jgi:hypothetical protein
LRVDLTSSDTSNSVLLVEHFSHLRKKILRELGYQIDFFKVRTSEGNGVLHLIWAIKDDKAVYISQEWLSNVWLSIHGAPVVWVKRMKATKSSVMNVGRYLTAQYFAGQNAIEQTSYSWKRCRLPLGRTWNSLKALFRLGSPDRPRVCWDNVMGKQVSCDKNPFVEDVEFKDLIKAWDSLLESGVAYLHNLTICISNRALWYFSTS